MKKFLFIFLSCLLFQQLTAQTIVKFDNGNNIIYKNLQGKTIVKNKKYTIAFTDTISSIGFVGTRKGEIVCINNAGKELFEVYKIDNGPDYVSDGLFRIVGKNSKIGFADTCGAIVSEFYPILYYLSSSISFCFLGLPTFFTLTFLDLYLVPLPSGISNPNA